MAATNINKQSLRSSNLDKNCTVDTDEITQDSDKFMEFVSDPESDLSVLANSSNVNLVIIKLLQQVVLTNQ